MDRDTRNKIQRATQAARRVLEDEYREQLEGTFDISLDGRIAGEPGSHLSGDQCVVREKLLAAVAHRRSLGMTKSEAVACYVREAAFTTLNQFVALKMLEVRGLVHECVSAGGDSRGFKEFTALAPGMVALPDRGYRLYIDAVFNEIAQEVQALFDRRELGSLLWPRRQPLQALLEVLNDPELAAVWNEDETIGWVYQYFNRDEERREMRAASQTPRNTRELAVRNQFFTPRYVVRFLADNTLGRCWHEMRQGHTDLGDAEFLARSPNEVFLAPGDLASFETEGSAASQDSIPEDYVPHREKKDPRDLKVLDPACGSGHFLLYAFDLFLKIYEEGWNDEAAPPSAATGNTLRADYPDHQALRLAIPGLILRHNLHGIDIDHRCAQIAALALWLRAQRAYNAFGIDRAERPDISRANIVVAEPMPGSPQMREEFARSLDPQLAELLNRLFETLKLAGEAGSLLKVENELHEAIRDVYGSAGHLFSEADEARWSDAERAVEVALADYAAQIGNGLGYRRQLFAEDAARGFGFIDLSRQRYDVILMNPPFGDRPKRCDEFFKENYPSTVGDLFSMFFERTLEWLAPGGRVGVISNRTWLGLPTFKGLRTEVIGPKGVVEVAADLGSFVLEAQVETAAVVLGNTYSPNRAAPWIRLLTTKAKEDVLREAIAHLRRGRRHRTVFLTPHSRFGGLPTGVFGYWMSRRLASIYKPEHSVGARAATVKQGTATADDFRFLRLAWEVPRESVGTGQQWVRFAKGGKYSPFYDDIHLVIRWDREGREIAAFPKAYIRNAALYGKPGVTWPLRTTSPFGPRLLPKGCAFGHKGPAGVAKEEWSPYALLAVLVSRPARLLLSVRLGAGDDAPGSASKSYEVGLVRDLPFPDLPEESANELAQLARRAVDLTLRQFRHCDETAALFQAPEFFLAESGSSNLGRLVERVVAAREDDCVELAEIRARIDKVVADALGFSQEDVAVLEEELEPPLLSLTGSDVADDLFSQAYLTKDPIPGERLPGGLEAEEDVRVLTRRRQQFAALRDEDTICRLFEISPHAFVAHRRRLQLVRQEDREEYAKQVVNYLVGLAFGRFMGQRDQESLEPLDPLPAPSTAGGRTFLVDDPGHAHDLRSAWVTALGTLKDDGGAFEEELCQVLSPGAPDIREWLRGSFFEDHLRRYSKSRRKAPIYWQLATASASYSVWILYSAATSDTLFRALDDLVVPKLQHEERRLSSLVQAASGEPSSRQRKEIGDQEQIVEELRSFRAEVARVAPLWNPSLDDGVLINFAPLWRLVPQNKAWQKACRDCWEKIQGGDYDWSHLAMHLWPERVVPKCANDRSLAIAHDLEDTFWEEDAAGKWSPRKLDEEAIPELTRERSSAAVKAALADLLSAPTPRGATTGRARAARKKRPTRRRTEPRQEARQGSDAGQDQVLAAIASSAEGASKADVIAATGVSDETWKSAIRSLTQTGTVTRTGRGRGTRYHANGTGDPDA